MDRAVYGTAFWISAPEKLGNLHNVIRVEGIPANFYVSARIQYHDSYTCFNGRLQLFSPSRLYYPPINSCRFSHSLSYHFTTALKPFSYDSIQLRYALLKWATLGRT